MSNLLRATGVVVVLGVMSMGAYAQQVTGPRTNTDVRMGPVNTRISGPNVRTHAPTSVRVTPDIDIDSSARGNDLSSQSRSGASSTSRSGAHGNSMRGTVRGANRGSFRNDLQINDGDTVVGRGGDLTGGNNTTRVGRGGDLTGGTQSLQYDGQLSQGDQVYDGQISNSIGGDAADNVNIDAGYEGTTLYEAPKIPVPAANMPHLYMSQNLECGGTIGGSLNLHFIGAGGGKTVEMEECLKRLWLEKREQMFAAYTRADPAVRTWMCALAMERANENDLSILMTLTMLDQSANDDDKNKASCVDNYMSAKMAVAKALESAKVNAEASGVDLDSDGTSGNDFFDGLFSGSNAATTDDEDDVGDGGGD